jgi:AraC family transcriptional regulator of adaptative response/methylated-DNA-[protein]-cysteine methyltransferase
MIKLTRIDTPIGEMVAGATDEGICLLEFSDRKMLNTEYKDIKKYFSTAIEDGENKHLEDVKIQLKEYFEGERKTFALQLLTPGSSFQKLVWKELMNIPYGSTRSYKEQAEALGNPGSIRAVARANGMNRIAIIIPCHRVIGTDGQLTGYGGGLKRKRWLLEHEKKFSGKAFDQTLF